MYGIVWRYLPRGSWKLNEKVYEDHERADADAAEWHNSLGVRAKVIYLGDSADWQ